MIKSNQLTLKETLISMITQFLIRVDNIFFLLTIYRTFI